MTSTGIQYNGINQPLTVGTLTAASQNRRGAVPAARGGEPRAARTRACRHPGDPAYLAMIEVLLRAGCQRVSRTVEHAPVNAGHPDAAV
jgi:hypothetical protein